MVVEELGVEGSDEWVSAGAERGGGRGTKGGREACV
jgi:hypothetical protein